MESPRTQEAIAFVEGLELPLLGKRRRDSRAPTAKKAVGDPLAETKKQAMVIGADIVSFVAGTDPRLRTAIMHCALLAQLAANRKVPSREDVRSWYEAYFDVLEQLGWAIQGRGFSEHHEKGDDFEAHQAILSVATTLLGPAPAALEVVKSTLSAMKATAKGSWMTIFQQESQGAKAARFQVTVAEPGCTAASQLKQDNASSAVTASNIARAVSRRSSRAKSRS